MEIVAAVAEARGAPFLIRRIDLADPREDEVLVRVVASGMCQTDLHARDGYYTLPYPAVFGHEGAGIVERVGARVTAITPGDHVVISFPWCAQCRNCERQMPAYCLNARKLKSSGTRFDGSTLMRADDVTVYSAFFGQSSFGSYAVTHQRQVVKVRKDAPLEHLGAFGCSVQTGAGAVLNAMQPSAGEAFVVFGAGAVGLSGLMAAVVAGCDPIVAVDVHAHRLELARGLGATHTIDHTRLPSVVDEVRAVTGGGARFSLETSALPQVFREAIDCLAPLGTCILVGTARAGTESKLEMPFLQQGRTVRGVVQGESRPTEFIPRLVDLYMAGRLPVDRMMTIYDLADINRAADDSSTGRTIKPVLRMPH